MLCKFHSNRDLILLQGSLGVWNRMDTPNSLTNDDEDDSSLNYILKKTKELYWKENIEQHTPFYSFI